MSTKPTPPGGQHPFTPWSTLGWSLALLVGSSIVGVWVLGLLAALIPGESLDFMASLGNAEQFGSLSEEEQDVISLYLLRATCLGALFGTAGIYYLTRWRTNGQAEDYLELIPVSWAETRPWLGITFGYVIVSIIFLNVYDSLFGLDQSNDPFMGLGLTPLVFCTFVIAAPIWEEALFRGFMFSGLKNSPLGVNGALVFPTLFWTSIHLQYEMAGLLVVLGFGVILAFARLRSGSLMLPIILHGFYNLLVVLLENL